MSRKRHSEKRWSVYRKFEPNRLAQAILAQAYEQIVPQHIRVLRMPVDELEQQRETYKPQKEGSMK